MYLIMWMLFVWALSFIGGSLQVIPNDYSGDIDFLHRQPLRQNDKFTNPTYPYVRGNGNNVGNDYTDDRISEYTLRCSQRLENALEKIRRREVNKQKIFNLHGYSLHQQLRSVPYDMYVTEMRVRLPTSSPWVKIDKCLFEPQNASLETRLVFNDLTISGKVNLFNEGELQKEPVNPDPEDTCNMILRLRRAGIGFHTEPLVRQERGQFNVKTDSYFVEPGFISVYAYGCESRLREHKRILNQEGDEDLSKEMEDIFLRGIRSLLTTYMQKELQPAIKETLMTNLGYTVSYG